MQYMPLYTGDYIRDTRHLSPMEHGIYLLLLMHCWDKHGLVPLDERQIFGICNARSNDEVEATRRVLREFFTLTDEGWYNTRLKKELDHATCAYSNKVEGARKARTHKGSVDNKVDNKPDNKVDIKLDNRVDLSLTRTRSRSIPEPDPDPDLLTSERLVVDSAGKNGANRPCPHQEIINLYHQILPNNPRVRLWGNKRKAHLRARWRQISDLDTWQDYFERVADTPFLTGKVNGKGRTPFFASLAWLVNEENFSKVIEGNYDG